MFPATAHRLRRNAPYAINARIAEETDARIRRLARMCAETAAQP